MLSDIRTRLKEDSQMNRGAFYSAVYDRAPLGVLRFFADWGYMAGEECRLEIETALGAAETFTEGQAHGAAIESILRKPAFEWTNFRGMIRRTGDERRALGPSDEGANLPDVERKTRRAGVAIHNLMETEAVSQVEEICDGDENFGDVSRVANPTLLPFEVDASGADLAVEAESSLLLNRWLHEGVDAPYGTDYDLIVVSPLQGGRLGAHGSNKAVVNLSQGGEFFATPIRTYLGKSPVVDVPGLTTTIMLGLSGVGGGVKWGWIWHEFNPGRFHVLDMGAEGQDNVLNVQISTSGRVGCNSPNTQGDLYGLATS